MSTELQEALAVNQVGALIPKQIDPVILEYVRRYAPLLRAIPSKHWPTNQYFFNQRTVLPSGGFVTDGGAQAVSSSTYVQSSFIIKLLQSVGAVTGFAQAVTAALVGDLRQKEIEGAMKGLAWDIENGVDWGNAAATVNGKYPQFDGLDVQVSTFSGASQNAINRAGNSFALADFDKVIDLVEENAAQPVIGDQWMLVGSPALQSKMAQLLLSQQRYMEVEIAAGLVVPSYRGIPFVKTSFLAARQQSMGTVTTATATSGGTLAAATYYYRVSAVIARYGEIAGCTEVSQTTTGSTSTVTLSFSTPTGPDGNQPTHYKVYRSTSTNTETLLGTVDAFDTTGVATTSIIDTGSNLLTNSSGNTGPAAYVTGNTGQPPLNTAEENFYLLPRDPDLMLRPYVREFELIPLAPTTAAPDILPFAVVSDTTLAIRGPKYVGRATRVAVAL